MDETAHAVEGQLGRIIDDLDVAYVIRHGTVVAGGPSGFPETPQRYMMYLIGVQVRQCKECHEERVMIPAVGQLLDTIANCLTHKQSALVGQEIRYLRKYLGYSGKKMAEVLCTSNER